MSTPSRTRTTSRTLLALTVAGACGSLLLPSGAVADPGVSLATAKTQLAALQQQQIGADEQLNQARAKADAAKTDAAKAQAAVTAQQKAYDGQVVATENLVVAQYESNGAGGLAAAVSAQSPDAFLATASTLSEVDRGRAHVMAGLLTGKKQLDEAEALAAQRTKDAAALEQQATAEQAKLDGLVASAQTLVSSLTAEQQKELQAAADAERAAAEKARAAYHPAAVIANVPLSGRAGAAVQAAYAELGKPYVYGAAGPNSFDCSGLMQWVWAKAGVSLPRTATAQYNATQRISAAQLQPGDLVFYNFGGGSIEHVGMYVGGGQMIDAPHTGSYVGVRGLYSGIAGYGRV